MTEADVRAIFTATRTIAVVGFSARPERASHRVAAFLQGRGYRVVPVNPGLAGQVVLGETVWANLAAIPPEIRIDMVDVFRAADAVPALVAEVLAHRPEVATLWMQLGVVHEAAAATARAEGIAVVMDRCPMIELPRLGL
jgi:predicted CoA-binding protein